MRTALIVVDMLNDFVTGALKCDRVTDMVPKMVKVVEHARRMNIPVIFSNDAHIDKIDREFKVWGPHAIEGTEGAKVIPELKYSASTDYEVPKRKYSGFFQTDLDMLLRELRIDTVVIIGIHTHICCRHTAADAFQLGYNVEVISDCTQAFTEEDYQSGLKYLKEVYGAKVYDSEKFVARFKKPQMD